MIFVSFAVSENMLEKLSAIEERYAQLEHMLLEVGSDYQIKNMLCVLRFLIRKTLDSC